MQLTLSRMNSSGYVHGIRDYSFLNAYYCVLLSSRFRIRFNVC